MKTTIKSNDATIQTLRGKPVTSKRVPVNVKFVCPRCNCELNGKNYNRYWHNCGKHGESPAEMMPEHITKLVENVINGWSKFHENEIKRIRGIK